jgi:hypothetical protein
MTLLVPLLGNTQIPKETMNKEKQSGIIRRPDFASGGITDEERERMTAHSALWIERAFRTEPADPAIIEEAIKGIYVAANLAEPRVIVVPSPFVMAMAGGIASFWWYLFENKLLGKKRGASGDDLTFAPFYDDTFLTTYAAATYAAIYAATGNAAYGATYEATRTAVRAATEDGTCDGTPHYVIGYAPNGTAHVMGYVDTTRAATYDATLNTTLNATDTVTRDAVRAATYDVTEAETSDASGTTEAATYSAIRAARQNWRALAASFVGEQWAQVALETAHCWETTYEGGNCGPNGTPISQPPVTSSVCDYPPTRPTRIGSRRPSTGGRWPHHHFCLVSNFPEILRVNASNQPHAEFGPSHRWRDGFEIWHLNGVCVEQWMAESHPEDMDARRVLQIKNVDRRRECIRRMGMERIIGPSPKRLAA